MRLFILLFLLLQGSGCTRRDAAARARPDILLISLDTVRADLLEPSPDNAALDMPFLRVLAERSLWFTNAVSPMAFTLPAHMTLLTGMHPESHGVSTQKDLLAPAISTLPMVLRDHGYRTAAAVCSSWLKPSFGFDRGFDRFVELDTDLTFADRVSDFVLEQFRDRPAGGPPLFVLAHFFDAHSDFEIRGNRLTYFSAPAYREGIDIPDQALCDQNSRCATDLLRFADRESRPVPESELRVHHLLYRRGARDLDNQLQRLFWKLDAAGVSNLLTVIVSDHGEEFREHGKFLHSQVFRESLRVPILFRLPRTPEGATSRGDRVGLVDVAPTILAYLGLSRPAEWQGRDLLSSSQGELPDAILVAQDKLVRTRYAIRTEDHLLIWDFAEAQGQLFDLRVDPAERYPLAMEGPEALALKQRLFSALRRLRAARRDTRGSSGEVFSDQEKSVLKSLGYL